MKRILFALLVLGVYSAGAQEKDSLRGKQAKNLLTAEIGFVNAGVIWEKAMENHWNLVLSSGVRLNYLPSGSAYIAYKEYIQGGIPASEDRFLDFGQAWPSLFLAAEMRHYFSPQKSTAVKSRFDGIYLGFKYILASGSFNTETEKTTSWGIFSSGQTVTRVSRYRSTHRLGMILGAQSFLGKKKSTVLSAEAGFGPMFNYDFSEVVLSPFLNFRLGVVLGRF